MNRTRCRLFAWLLVALVGWGTSSLVATAQTVARRSEAMDQHKRVVRAERTEQFARAWASAGANARASAVEWIAESRRAGAPLGNRPSLAVLGDATRLLLEQSRRDQPDADAWDQFADSLDVHITPGAFESHDQGRGDPLVVRVYRLYGDGGRDCLARVFWRAPSGEERLARTARIEAGAFAAQGFELYVWAPLSEPGVWELVLELEADGNVARVPSVRVECVEDLRARIVRVFEAESYGAATSASSATAELLAHARELLDFGVRVARGPRLGIELTQFEQRSSGARLAEPNSTGPTPLDGGRGWSLDPVGDEPRALCVFVRPTEEAPDGLFTAQNISTYRRHLGDCALASISIDRDRGFGLLDGIAAARAAYPRLPTVLVVRGNALGPVAFALLGGAALDVDGFVFLTEAPQPLAGLPEVPTLFLSTAKGGSGGNAKPLLTSVRLEGSAFAEEFELAQRITLWLDDNSVQFGSERVK